MPYVCLSDLTADIPPDFITQALDDNGDGAQDEGLWDLIASRIAEEIDGAIGRRYSLPLVEPYPEFVTSSAKTLACDKLYKRRGIEDMKNPWAKAAAAVRATLKDIMLGDEPLSPELNRKDPSASVVTQRMGTAPGRHAINSA